MDFLNIFDEEKIGVTQVCICIGASLSRYKIVSNKKPAHWHNSSYLPIKVLVEKKTDIFTRIEVFFSRYVYTL